MHVGWSRRRSIACDSSELWDLEGKELSALGQIGYSRDQMPSETATS